MHVLLHQSRAFPELEHLACGYCNFTIDLLKSFTSSVPIRTRFLLVSKTYDSNILDVVIVPRQLQLTEIIYRDYL